MLDLVTATLLVLGAGFALVGSMSLARLVNVTSHLRTLTGPAAGKTDR